MRTTRPFQARACLLAPLLLAACGESAAPSPGDAAPDGRPDVVLVVVDTLRADRLGCYGHERATSPNLDALATTATRFERAISQAPWTTPSIASLMTSRYPTQLGIHGERSAIPPEAATLAETLGAAGFATAAVVSHSYCSATWGFDQGFEGFDDSNVRGHDAVTSAGVTERALAFLDAARADERPFFLWVHYFDPHCAYIEHEAHRFGGAGDYDGPIRSGQKFRRLLKLRGELGDADAAELLRLYDSEIAHTDAELGRLLERLERDHPGALVIVTSDHGEEFLERGDLGHAKTLYDEVVRVPLLVRFPGRAPAVERSTVALVDVYPTILEVVGVPAPPGLEGASLVRGAAPAAGDRIVFTETARMGGLVAAVTDAAKVVHELKFDQHQGFDLGSDPGERRGNSLAADERERLAGELAAFVARVRAEALVAPDVEVDGETDRNLSELGYGGDGEDEDER